MGRTYQNIGKQDREKLTEFLSEHGQHLLPMVELIEQSRLTVDELIEMFGRSAMEACSRNRPRG